MEPVFHVRKCPYSRAKTAECSGANRAREDAAERRIDLLDARDGVLDPPLDVDARALRRGALLPAASTETECARELLLEHVALASELLEPPAIGARFRFFDFGCQIAQ